MLAKTQLCTLGSRDIVWVNASGLEQQLSEENLTQLLSIINQRNGSQQCRDDVLSVMCLTTFPLGDKITGQLYQLTRDECERVSEQVCPHEWNLTTQLGYQYLLPDCAKLTPLVQLPHDPPSVICREDFVNIRNICLPRCDSWSMQSPSSTIATRAVKFTFSFCAIFGGIGFLVASAIRYKQMFKFPLILLIYMTSQVFVLGFVVLITEAGSPSLLCSADSIFHSILSSTPLCLISGAVFHYTLVSLTMFWFFHVCVFFYKVMFPFHAKAHRSREKYLHLGMAVAGFILPIPAVIVGLTVEDAKYSINIFPPSICGSRSFRLLFYSSDLFMNLMMSIGTSLLILTTWEVHKKQGIFRKKSGHKVLTTTEKKLMLNLFHYVLFALFGVLYFIYILATGDMLTEAFVNYFACELHGHVPGKCDRRTFEQLDANLWLYNVSLFLLGLVPTVNLIFVINFKKCTKLNHVKPPQLLKRASEKILMFKNNSKISSSSIDTTAMEINCPTSCAVKV